MGQTLNGGSQNTQLTHQNVGHVSKCVIPEDGAPYQRPSSHALAAPPYVLLQRRQSAPLPATIALRPYIVFSPLNITTTLSNCSATASISAGRRPASSSSSGPFTGRAGRSPPHGV
ncbi:hypothetical protein AcV7_009252 [Taiwanofungus camphoratus]|nr:hypothetical protein AcV7_009252 [Antrodia cinnamomea]